MRRATSNTIIRFDVVFLHLGEKVVHDLFLQPELDPRDWRYEILKGNKSKGKNNHISLVDKAAKSIKSIETCIKNEHVLDLPNMYLSICLVVHIIRGRGRHYHISMIRPSGSQSDGSSMPSSTFSITSSSSVTSSPLSLPFLKLSYSRPSL